jgi:rod shape determining protein RodA
MVGLKIDRRLLQNVDWLLLATAFAVIGLGLLTLHSLAAAGTKGGVGWRQLSWVGVGLLALILTASLDYRRVVRFAPVLYLGGVALLVAVLVVGRPVAGARRWISLGAISLQPSELFKLIFVATLVWVLTSRWAHPLSRGVILFSVGLLAIPFLLVMRQPDLGTALVLLPLLLVILTGAGVRFRLVGWLGAGTLAAAPLLWVFLKGYQRERLLVYLDPSRDPLGSAYNVIQSKIAIGSGQFFGKGIDGATQSRLAFLPERHTDFIFSVFAEQWGFVGGLVLLTLYTLLLLRGFEIAATAREPVGRCLALGVTALLAAQTLINVGMATGLLPVVGLPLPLMSYGGSSMVASLMALGLLLSVRMRQFR